MGVLGNLFGGSKKETVVVEPPPCPHAVLMPRWDSVADMGKDDLATRFVCEACHQEFTPEEARALRDEPVTGRLLHQDAGDESRWAAPKGSATK